MGLLLKKEEGILWYKQSSASFILDTSCFAIKRKCGDVVGRVKWHFAEIFKQSELEFKYLRKIIKFV